MPRARTYARTATVTALPTRARRAAGTATVEEHGSLFGRLVPYDVVAEVVDPLPTGGTVRYREVWRAGSVTPAATVPVYAGHAVSSQSLDRGPLVGRVVDVEERADGLYGRVMLAATVPAAELRSLAQVVGAHFSIEFTDRAGPARDGELVERSGAELTGVAVLVSPARPAFAGAEVLSVRAAPDPDPDDDDDEDQGDGEAEGTGDAGPVSEGPPVAARAFIEREVARALGRAGGRGVSPAHPLARFDSAYAFFAAARASDDVELAHLFRTGYYDHVARARAWVDQLTPENPGVMPPGWLTTVYGVIDLGRPAITAVGPIPLPPEGMDINWPYFDGDLHTIVGEQTTEKTEITSVKVSLKKGNAPLRTFAGGSDVSWQLIRRSSPSYREVYLRILNAAYGVITDREFCDALVAGAGSTVDYDPAGADADGSALRTAVFDASMRVQRATGAPANVVLANDVLFLAFGGVLMPSVYGTQNVSGTATASTLDVNVSGLRVVYCPDLTTGTATDPVGIATNGLASGWMEDGPFAVSAPEINKLGEDIAVWGMGNAAIPVPAGVVKIAAPPTVPLAATAKSK